MQTDRIKTVILGAGLTGLSAAYHLEKKGFGDYVILEGGDEVGGLARTETYQGFSFDHAIHILYTSDSYAADLIANQLLPGNLKREQRESYCYSHGVFTEYPYQTNNFGLPPRVIAENILGLIQAHAERQRTDSPANYEEWIHKTFGSGIAKHFMIPYNRRQWAWDLKDMNFDWIQNRVPVPDLREVILGALQKPVKKFGPNREFWYPEIGGIEALAQAFVKFIPQERIHLNSRVEKIDSEKKEICLENGRVVKYGQLITTLPLNKTAEFLGGGVPEALKRCARGLKHNTVHTVNIGLKGAQLGADEKMHWVYFPGEETVFHRISFPHHFSSNMAPAGCASIQAEISESVLKSVNSKTLIQDTLTGLVRSGILTEEEIRPASAGGRVVLTTVMTLHPAYVIYDFQHRENTQSLIQYLEKLDIQTCGRFGQWEYFNMDHSILSGKKAAETILNAVVKHE